jgi:hypothetical protein
MISYLLLENFKQSLHISLVEKIGEVRKLKPLESGYNTLQSPGTKPHFIQDVLNLPQERSKSFFVR